MTSGIPLLDYYNVIILCEKVRKNIDEEQWKASPKLLEAILNSKLFTGHTEKIIELYNDCQNTFPEAFLTKTHTLCNTIYGKNKDFPRIIIEFLDLVKTIKIEYKDTWEDIRKKHEESLRETIQIWEIKKREDLYKNGIETIEDIKNECINKTVSDIEKIKSEYLMNYQYDTEIISSTITEDTTCRPSEDTTCRPSEDISTLWEKNLNEILEKKKIDITFYPYLKKIIDGDRAWLSFGYDCEFLTFKLKNKLGNKVK